MLLYCEHYAFLSAQKAHIVVIMRAAILVSERRKCSV